ncbi:MAG: winged helix-turn-helix domain-containing protein [Chloroflexota bacterium]
MSLLSPISNPFFHRGRPIRDIAYFFGRQRELAKAINLLRHGQSISVIGPRRIGKTSFLNRLMADSLFAEGAETAVFLSIDGMLCSSLTPAEFLAYLLDELIDQTQLEPPTASSSLAALTFAIRTLRWQGKIVLIFIDEFEALSQNPYLDETFFSQLRGLAMQFDATYITASAQPLLALTYAKASVLSSPFFNIFASVPLGLFSLDEANELLLGLSKREERPFSPQTIATILDWAGTHPLLLQIAAYYAFDVLANEAPDLTTARASFVQDAHSHWLYAWLQLSAEGQRLLALLPSVAVKPPSAIAELEKAGLVWQTETGYQALSPAFAEFVRQQAVDGLIQEPPFTLVPEQKLVLLRGTPIRIPPTEFRLLQTLLENAGQVVAYQMLSERLWPDEVQHEPDMERIKTAVKILRRALANDKNCIQNIPRVGYQFIP